MSEQQPTGWVCPLCGCALAPWVSKCTCAPAYPTYPQPWQPYPRTWEPFTPFDGTQITITTPPPEVSAFIDAHFWELI